MSSPSPSTIGSEVDAWIGGILRRQPVVGLAVAVVGEGATPHFNGCGLADISSGDPITEGTVFRIASITKTFTAIAVMQLWERGLVDLDAPASTYLRSYRLLPARPGLAPPTLRHLMTHTAGLPEVSRPRGVVMRDWGESVPVGKTVPSLAEFYGPGLKWYAEPGTRFIYNNHGPATLGQIVEDVTGESLDRYLRAHLFEPLGMADTDLLRSEQVGARLATGYEIRSRDIKKVPERDFVTAGAASIYSTPKDMARYAAALLGGGRNSRGSVLRPATLSTMFEPQYQPDPRLPGMGLGFFRMRLDDLLAVGHQGTLPGFHSQITVVPDRGVAVMAFTNGAHQPDFWLPAAVLRLLRQLLGGPGAAGGRLAPHHPDIWDAICGWYRLGARFTDVRLRVMIGAGAEVFVRGGRLMVRFLSPVPALAAGLPLQPDDEADPWAFRMDLPDEGAEPIRIVFGRDPAGSTRLHLDLMPVRLEKQSPSTNPRRWAAVALAGVAAAAAGRRRASKRTRGRKG